jgi:glycosyltransferase 2 family protein
MNFFKTFSKLFFTVVLPTAIVIVFLLKIDIDSLTETLAHIRYDYFLFAFVLFFVNAILRGVRFYYLLGSDRPDLFSLIKLQLLLSFFNNYFPVGATEVSFVLLAKKHLNVPSSLGTAVIIYSRFYDYFTLCLVFFLYFSLFGGNYLDKFSIPLAIFSLFLLLFFIVTFIMPRFPMKIVKYLNSLFILEGKNPFKEPVKKAIVWSESFVKEAERVGSIRTFAIVGAITIMIWCTIFGNYMYTAMSIGAPLTYIGAVLVSLMGFMVKFIQGVASLGSHELAWYTGLSILGYTSENAMETALGTHIVFLIYPLITGILGWIFLMKRSSIEKKKL